MMEVIRNAKKEDIPELKTIWKNTFHDSDSFIDWYFSERFLPEYTACLIDNGHIASVAYTYPLSINLFNRPVPSALLNGVATLPAYSGKGYMKKTLHFLFSSLREKGVVLIPHTPVNIPVYRSIAHYEAADALYASLSKTNLPDSLPEGLSVAPLFSANDALLSCYNKLEKHYSGMALRSANDLLLRLNDYKTDESSLLLYKKDDALLGYAVFSKTEEGINAPECISLAPEGYNVLLSGLSFLAKGAGGSVKLPPDAQVSFPGKQEQKAVLGLIKTQALLKSLSLQSTIPIRVIDPFLPQNSGSYLLNGTSTSANPAIEMNTGRFIQLILGYVTLDELLSQELITVFDNSQIPALETLFSKRPCYIIDEY